jgi:hypothetical protein
LLETNHSFLQLAGSNIKERKSKTKEWNDRIKKEKVSGNSASIFFFFFV